MERNHIRQAVEGAELLVDPAAGGRIVRLTVGGHDLLVSSGRSSIDWGCYPMAPWAGRVRHGEFHFAGQLHRLPRNLGDHAIHGTVFEVGWRVVDEGHLVADLAAPWPWSGEVHQFIRLERGKLRLKLEVHARDAPMPASCGWHPWFRREVGGVPARLSFRASHMERRDADGIPSGERVPVPAGPWDDCFGGIDGPAVLTWPGIVRLSIASTCDYLVVYDERSHAVCVEPQTAPPDALNRGPFVVERGRPLTAESEWTWVLG